MLRRAPGLPEPGERTPFPFLGQRSARGAQSRAAAPPRGGSGQGSATLRLPAPCRGAAAESRGPPQHNQAEKPHRFPTALGTAAAAPTGGRHGPGLALPFPHIGGAARRCIPRSRSLAPGTAQDTAPGSSRPRLPPAAPPAEPGTGCPCPAARRLSGARRDPAFSSWLLSHIP